MSNCPNQPAKQLEPLPGDFSAKLHQLDAQLSRYAASQPQPRGMSDRIFAASVGLLPGVDGSAVPQPQLRLVPGVVQAAEPAASSRLLLHRTVFGRIAMAASVAIACVVAAWMLQSSANRQAQPHRTAVASNRHATLETVRPIASAAMELPMISAEQWAYDMDDAHAMGSEYVESRVGYLMVTSAITSADFTDLASRF